MSATRSARPANDAPPTAQPDPPTPSRRGPLADRWLRGGRSVLRGARAWWAAVPLRGRLVALITVLLAAGLAIAGTTTAVLTQRHLVAQVDEQLSRQAQDLAQAKLDQLFGGSSVRWDRSVLPSDYSVVVTLQDGATADLGRQATYEEYGRPRLPAMTAQEAVAADGSPFTVGSTRAGSSWRTVVIPFQTATGYPLTAAVSLPLTDIESTVHRIVLVLVLSGVGIVALGAVVGGWAVRRSLRPLRQIEDTAAAIAAGDLARRVPAAPAGTEVGRLGGALNGMLSQIEQAFASRTASEQRMRRFVADASHELRTPLAAIRGYSELYRMGALTEPAQVDDTMRRIEQSASRMGVLVEDLLTLARMDDGRPLRADEVDLTVLAADALSDLHALDPTRPLHLEPTSGPCVVIGDEPRLRQVVANLVGNVVQHTPAGSPVEIGAAARDGAGVLWVRDHGPGIDPEHAARVFERFYRVDASRSRGAGGSAGAGLGMAIVAAIVAAHHGEVSISQTAGGGTTVQVTLPVAGGSEGRAAHDPTGEGPPTR
ncbi:sensor histidine kinase [Cellulomonas chengniuliangii]|uniref:histidine kinase n=1 Tax=Cellulomonas chengniuliangii TaxID=2968084 RepID=A0ABY5L1U6_9CELL|nr:HAMP domain-containing sensor histidine kinase [Cellulomonas chengniuliangii]MCC2307294.1 HAMP domain-containing histidine kinase [Cellulomonas chengniuliangii]MCC2317810.1 HAMP domain-containing histidine kinase [Cellulomonas chengniuliangii]UUI75915.1 HAMP domain-containing histidine kinase [Cellulomonas chengniuliangii]